MVSQGNGPTALDGALSQSSAVGQRFDDRLGWVGYAGASTYRRGSMIGEEYDVYIYIHLLFIFGLMSFFCGFMLVRMFFCFGGGGGRKMFG